MQTVFKLSLSINDTLSSVLSSDLCRSNDKNKIKKHDCVSYTEMKTNQQGREDIINMIEYANMTPVMNVISECIFKNALLN